MSRKVLIFATVMVFSMIILVVFFYIVGEIDKRKGSFYESENCYVLKDSIFPNMFKEAVESIYVIFNNGDYYKFTSYEEKRISINSNEIIDFIERENRELNDVVIIVHNHFAYPTFSLKNNEQLSILRRKGYRGSFCLYVTSSGKVKADIYREKDVGRKD